jgi:two-component system, OmpR family, copper resistance phosphate regulon response regulator CusR
VRKICKTLLAMQKIKILVVEDEKKIAESIAKGLMELQYAVEIAYDGLEGKKLLNRTEYDLVILDIHLPHMNGYELCQFIRSNKKEMLVIMLTAMDSIDNRLAGFDAGADDYLIKPFDFKELVARIRALTKRLAHHIQTDTTLTVSNLVMNLDSKKVIRGNKAILLTAKEFQLLEYFIKNKNRVVSRADIAIDVWDIDFDTKTNVIDVYVNFLRNKIDKDFEPKLIHTHIGMGYVLKETE